MNKKNNIDKIIYVFLLIIMICIPICKSLSYVSALINFNARFILKLRAYFLWISIIFMLTIYLYSVISKKKKINYVDYIFYILIFLGIISTIFALDFKKSLFGEINRYEGLLTLISYYLITLNAKNLDTEKYKKNILKVFLCLGIIQSIIGIMQVLSNNSYIKRFPISYMAMGLCSNPNFYGSYVSMLLSISTVYFIQNREIKSLLLCVLFSMNLYLAGSTGPMLGFAISFIFISILLRKKIKRILAILLVILLSFNISDNLLFYYQKNVNNIDIVNKYNIKNDVKDTYNNITSGDEKKIEKIGSGRLKLWKDCMPLIKKYWLTGAGIDNFKDAYPQTGRIQFDKAHNVYLQMAITNGIFALLAYCFLCLIIFLKGIKFNKTFYIALYMAFVTYCIQAFANISVLDVAPYFYLIMGLLCSKIKTIKIKK